MKKLNLNLKLRRPERDPLAGRSTVGLDIGTTAVRAVEVTGEDDGTVRIGRLAVVPLPPGAMTGGRIGDLQAVSLAIDEALTTLGAGRRRVVVGIATPDTAVANRIIHAGLRRHEREAVIRNDTLPVTARLRNEDAALDTYAATSVVNAEGVARDEIVVAAANRDHVDEIVRACKLVGFEPLAIDLSGAAMLRALVRVPEDDDSVAAYCDLGASRSTVVVRRGRHIRSLRTINTGGDEITRAVMNVTGDDWVTAERRKRALRPTGARAEVVMPVGYGEQDEDLTTAPAVHTLAEEAYTTALDALVEQLALGLDNARRGGDEPQAVVLVGRSAQLNGLTERLANRTGLQVIVSRPWAELVRNKANAPHLEHPARLGELLLSLTTACGLSQWRDHL